MKVGIVSLFDYTNFGNRLQNYALQFVLQKYFNCTVVTLVSYKEKPYNNGDYIGWIKDRIAKQMCIVPTLAEKRFGANITRWANFYNWSKQIASKKYYNCSHLPKSISKQFDYFLAGSDQIWNFHWVFQKPEDFFLTFADKNKRIAISASFGTEDIPDELKQTYLEYLKDFAHISVREDAGQAIVKKVTGQNVPVLIDPTMMLSKEEWLKVSKRPRADISKPYVLKYYLGDESEEAKIDRWAKDNGYEVYELLNESTPELYSAGPGEFISLINNASLVCSDSFHCIVFSIIFSKPFIVYERKGHLNYMTSRLDTLLNKFGFQDRWNSFLNENDYLNCDYGNVRSRLNTEQDIFISYLKNALK